MKLWGGRFNKSTASLVDEYNASIQFDQRLAIYDIQGSLAHVQGLEKCGILSSKEAKILSQGLALIADKLDNNALPLSITDEDIHMNIERILHQEVGDVAAKLHTGRSRNDQVALDLRLFLRSHVLLVIEKLIELQGVLFKQAETNFDTFLPGYTHLQRAQPVLFSHHVLAYSAMFERDIARLMDSWARINILPLGSGAIAGTTYPLDRHYIADLLHFDAISENSMDAVSDRDFIVEFLSHCALIMMHISRFSEEIVLWSSEEFSFVELDDAYTTGSSMMPQKKNPDVAELARGKTGRVYGALIGILTVLKGLPLTYNKDLQEDKEGLFDSVDTVLKTLSIFAPMVETMQINKQAMQNAAQKSFTNATDLADYLVKKGMAFRQAHAIVGEAVLHCLKKQCYLMDLSLADYQQFSTLFTEDVFDAINVKNTIEARQIYGGTATLQVQQQLTNAYVKHKRQSEWVREKKSLVV